MLLGANLKEVARKQLHRSVRVTGEAEEAEQDDYHLLLEYDIGDVWGQWTSPRANRFIIHNDYSNMMLASMDSFVATLHQFKAFPCHHQRPPKCWTTSVSTKEIRTEKNQKDFRDACRLAPIHKDPL